ncbi:PREDICTED: uncharacterized protein LOC106750421 isoform X2 [Dinoponera quadriceps]|nr:PREDICTED: uncharacterized protein LOC106750421 isoform X2 [Dinoponera quadriceps]
MLRTYVSVLENKLKTPKFGQLHLVRKAPLSLHSEAATYRDVDLPDVRTELCCDFYRFAGIRYTRCDSTFVFEMSGTDKVTRSGLYAVEILTDNNGCGKLGRWALPMSVDVQKILLQHPIDDLNNMRQFVKSTKHHVDCYVCRAKQLEELQSSLAEIENARVSHIIGVVQVELVMSGVKDSKSDAVRNVTLDLCYKPAEVRPYKLLPDVDDNEKPSADLLNRLYKHFEPFLKNDLSSAFQRVNESETEFCWKPIAANGSEGTSEFSDESLENSGFLSAYLYRGKKKRKKGKDDEQGGVNHGNKKNSARNAGSKRRERTRNRKLLKKTNGPDCEDTKSPRREYKQKKVITWFDKADKEDRAVSNINEQNRQARMNLSCSTPLSKELPDKRKFFQINNISGILKQN